MSPIARIAVNCAPSITVGPPMTPRACPNGPENTSGYHTFISGSFLYARVAHPHRGMRVVRADRQILGHPLDEPQRQCLDAATAAVRGMAGGDVVLERVHQLVTEYVVCFGERCSQRKDHAPLQSFCHTTSALTDRATDDVRLLEVGVGSVQKELWRDRIRLNIERVAWTSRGHPPTRQPQRASPGKNRYRMLGLKTRMESFIGPLRPKYGDWARRHDEDAQKGRQTSLANLRRCISATTCERRAPLQCPFSTV